MTRKLLTESCGQSAIILVCIALLLDSCTGTKQITKGEPSSASLHIMQEFRAAWVATVANINWPSKPELPMETQKQEAIALLDFLQVRHFNAVILQVRPQADALYKSDIEPWSYYLTGTQGKAPELFYDLLECWVKELFSQPASNKKEMEELGFDPESKKQIISRLREMNTETATRMADEMEAGLS